MLICLVKEATTKFIIKLHP